MVIATVRQCPRYVLLARHFARVESVDGPPGRRTGGRPWSIEETRVRRASLPRDGTVIRSRVSSLEAGTGLNQLAVRVSQAVRLAVGARSDRRFPRSLRQRGAVRLEHVPMLSNMTERMTTEVQCRRYAAPCKKLPLPVRKDASACIGGAVARPCGASEPGFATSSVQRRIAPRSLCSLIFNC
jgi:hypothetical protein